MSDDHTHSMSNNSSTIKRKQHPSPAWHACAGFTLIEVLLVIAILAILATIVIIAINPSKQLGESQNAQRRNDVKAILDAVYQYALDNNGQFPAGIDGPGNAEECIGSTNIICTEGTNCGNVSLDELVLDDKYMVDIPSDPTAGDSEYTGYYIVQTSRNRISVCAPSAYGGEVIMVTR
jgi:prepilin-type N-terminal cleavage/methylation domain-containing protein